MKLLCVCDEEMCFCTNMVEVKHSAEVERFLANTGLSPLYPPPEVPCDECAAGHHVWSPVGERSERVRQR